MVSKTPLQSKALGGLIVLGLLASCSDPTSAGTNGCEAGTVVTVSSGLTPVIRWTPKCFIGGLLVDRTGLDLWTVTSRQGGAPANVMASGITYGTVPFQGHATSPADPLTVGVLHTVHIYVYPPGQAPIEVGHVDFTP